MDVQTPHRHSFRIIIFLERCIADRVNTWIVLEAVRSGQSVIFTQNRSSANLSSMPPHLNLESGRQLNVFRNAPLTAATGVPRGEGDGSIPLPYPLRQLIQSNRASFYW